MQVLDSSRCVQFHFTTTLNKLFTCHTPPNCPPSQGCSLRFDIQKSPLRWTGDFPPPQFFFILCNLLFYLSFTLKVTLSEIKPLHFSLKGNPLSEVAIIKKLQTCCARHKQKVLLVMLDMMHHARALGSCACRALVHNTGTDNHSHDQMHFVLWMGMRER